VEDGMTLKHFTAETVRWAQLLGLQAWKIEVVEADGPSVVVRGDDCYASISVDRSSMSAVVEVALGSDDSELERIPRHEMLHLLLHELTDVEDHLLDSLGAAERRLAEVLLREKQEQVVITLERAFGKVGERG
jgi:hypothetical protein